MIAQNDDFDEVEIELGTALPAIARAIDELYELLATDPPEEFQELYEKMFY